MVAVAGAGAGAPSSSLPSFPFLALIVSLPPTLTKPNPSSQPTQPPKHFRQAQPAPPAPAPPSCRSGCQFTHAFIRTHSRPFPLLPLPISLTHPGLPPATPQLIPYSTPKSSLSFLASPRNQNNSCHKQPHAVPGKINSFLSNTDIAISEHENRLRIVHFVRSF